MLSVVSPFVRSSVLSSMSVGPFSIQTSVYTFVSVSASHVKKRPASFMTFIEQGDIILIPAGYMIASYCDTQMTFMRYGHHKTKDNDIIKSHDF